MRARRTSVLMYHDVIEVPVADSSGFPGAAAAMYKVDADLFEQHLDAIERRAGEHAARFPDPGATTAGGGWLLTFDDGGVGAITHVAQRLEARQWRGILFVTTDRVDTPGFLKADQVRELAERGHVIGSQSRSQPRRMSACTREEVRAEWRESVLALAEMLGGPVVHASIPNGYFSRIVGQEASAAGIRVLFTSDSTRSWYLLDGCLVVGRYNVRTTSSLEWVAAVAAGDRVPRYTQWLEWKLKGVVKAVAGDRYQWLRQRWRPGNRA